MSEGMQEGDNEMTEGMQEYLSGVAGGRIRVEGEGDRFQRSITIDQEGIHLGPIEAEVMNSLSAEEEMEFLLTLPVPASDQALRVYLAAADTLEKFNEKNKDYGDTSYLLGVKGQFADMHRKMGKLKRALWDDIELNGEDEIEILRDLVGHALLTIDFLEQEKEKKEEELDVF